MESESMNPLLLTKLRVEETINKIKNQSPRLQEVLRQRCRQRMKERRKETFNARRLGLGDDTSEKPEESDVEMEQDEEYLMYEDYERMLQEEIQWIESLVYDRNKIICPVCQTDLMIEMSECVYCKDCGFWPSNCKDLITLGELIDNSINHHSINCTAIPGFTTAIENNSSVLYMTCYECSYLSCVV